MVGPVPTSDYSVFHTCEQGADVTEHGGYETELFTSVPSSTAKFVL